MYPKMGKIEGAPQCHKAIYSTPDWLQSVSYLIYFARYMVLIKYDAKWDNFMIYTLVCIRLL